MQNMNLSEGILRLDLDSPCKLADIATSPETGKNWDSRAKDSLKKLRVMQEKLCAENKKRVLVILQAMDAGGKDGVIRHLFVIMDPQGARVVNFKVPTQQEAQRDYLWRVHKEVPTNGEMVIFNRSHFEDILVGQIDEIFSERVINQRVEHINQFEKMLSDEGTTIIKIFLHISKEEQLRRFEDRLKSKTNGWKLTYSDLENHQRWEKYSNAYSELLPRTSTPWAPWFIVPADDRPARNVLVTELILSYMIALNPIIPKSEVKHSDFANLLGAYSLEN